TKNGQQYCRFGFPKDNVEYSFIHKNDRGQPELITLRNNPYVNSYNHVQLQGWRANVDLKPVLNIHAALHDSSGSSLPSFQRLLLHTVLKHNYSA
ncbi:hypothetical protein RhiirA5_446460, partial [Rhizophagus irregularis]